MARPGCPIALEHLEQALSAVLHILLRVIEVWLRDSAVALAGSWVV